MTRPGTRLRRLCVRWFSDDLVRRLVEPAIADMQAEHAAAQAAGSRWQSASALAGGFLAVSKIIGIALVLELCGGFRNWQPQERATARGGLRVALISITLATAALEANTFYHLQSIEGLLAVYLLPSTLFFTLPMGLALGVAYCVHGATRRKLAIAALALAVTCSSAMALSVAWLTPNANQAFRELFFARTAGVFHPPPTRGDNELTWSQHRERRNEMLASGQIAQVREFDLDYQIKWELSTAAVPLVALILAVARRRRWSRAALMASTIPTCLAYFVALIASSYLVMLAAVPVTVAGWSADAVCVVSLLIMRRSSRVPELGLRTRISD